ncbi:hypothetical protein [Burkholderia phage BCSR129]|nr:hypothetical protein [Burkholderia phage BCSR129]
MQKVSWFGLGFVACVAAGVTMVLVGKSEWSIPSVLGGAFCLAAMYDCP